MIFHHVELIPRRKMACNCKLSAGDVMGGQSINGMTPEEREGLHMLINKYSVMSVVKEIEVAATTLAKEEQDKDNYEKAADLLSWAVKLNRALKDKE